MRNYKEKTLVILNYPQLYHVLLLIKEDFVILVHLRKNLLQKLLDLTLIKKYAGLKKQDMLLYQCHFILK